VGLLQSANASWPCQTYGCCWVIADKYACDCYHCLKLPVASCCNLVTYGHVKNIISDQLTCLGVCVCVISHLLPIFRLACTFPTFFFIFVEEATGLIHRPSVSFQMRDCDVHYVIHEQERTCNTRSTLKMVGGTTIQWEHRRISSPDLQSNAAKMKVVFFTVKATVD